MKEDNALGNQDKQEPQVPEQPIETVVQLKTGKFEVIEDYEQPLTAPVVIQVANIDPFDIPLEIEENIYKENLIFISSIPNQTGVKIYIVDGKLARADGGWFPFFYQTPEILTKDAF